MERLGLNVSSGRRSGGDGSDESDDEPQPLAKDLE